MRTAQNTLFRLLAFSLRNSELNKPGFTHKAPAPGILLQFQTVWYKFKTATRLRNTRVYVIDRQMTLLVEQQIEASDGSLEVNPRWENGTKRQAWRCMQAISVTWEDEAGGPHDWGLLGLLNDLKWATLGDCLKMKHADRRQYSY